MAASLLRVLSFSLVLTLASAGCGVPGEKGQATVVTETVTTVTGGPARGGVDVPAASADALSASTAASPAGPVPFSVAPEYLNAVVSGTPGPAGLAAAVEASRLTDQVVLIDAGPRPGGRGAPQIRSRRAWAGRAGPDRYPR